MLRVVGARLHPENGESTVSERDGWVCGLRWATRLASLVTHWAVALGETVGGLGVPFRPFSLSLRASDQRCATTRWKCSLISRSTTRRTPSTRQRGSLSSCPMRMMSSSFIPGGTVNVD